MIATILLTATIVLHKVHDGDSVRLYLGEGKKSIPIRMYCIDAPELKQKHGVASREYMKSLFRGKKNISIRKVETDRYGRTVAEVFVDGRNVNMAMVEAGQVYVYEEYCRDALYGQAEKTARVLKRGVWGDKDAIEPKVWRKEQKKRRK